MKKTTEWGGGNVNLYLITVASIFKHLQLNDNSRRTRRKILSRFPEENTWMAKKHEKRHTRSLITRKMQIKTAVRSHFTLTRLAEIKRANVEDTATGVPPKRRGRDAEALSEKTGPGLSGHTHTHSPLEPRGTPAFTRENENERRAVTGLLFTAQAGRNPSAHRLASRYVNGAPDTHWAPVHGWPGAAEARFTHSERQGIFLGEELKHVCPGSALLHLYGILEKAKRRWWKPSR